MGQQTLQSFLAIFLPTELQVEVSRLQEQLQSLNFPLTWELPEKLHITLAFLGKVKDPDLHQLHLALQSVLNKSEPFETRPTHLNYFYKKHADSIVYLELENENELKKLGKEVRDTLISKEFSPPQRFKPHVAIARLKRMRHPNQVKEVLFKVALESTPKFSPFWVEKVDILKSAIDSKGITSNFFLNSSVMLGSNHGQV